MTSVQIKNVPAETHEVLRRRAAAAHQSLQEYLRSRLIEEASRATVDEILARVEARSNDGRVGFDDAVDILRRDRGRR